FSTATIAISAPPGSAPARVSGYDLPPHYVLDVLHAPAPPRPILSPTRASVLLVAWVQYPPMSQVAEPFLKLARVLVEPRTRRKHDARGGYGVAVCADTLRRGRRHASRDVHRTASRRLRRRILVGTRRRDLRVPQHHQRSRGALGRRS